jgi:hypothetical protein
VTSDREIPVRFRIRELATGHRSFFVVGVRHSFGSIFDNVVNPRFRCAGADSGLLRRVYRVLDTFMGARRDAG